MRVEMVIAALALPATAGAQTSNIASAGSSVAVIHVEGHPVTLWHEPAASGARYGWPNDGAGPVFWTKAAEATVAWRDGTGAEPVTVYSACRVG